MENRYKFLIAICLMGTVFCKAEDKVEQKEVEQIIEEKAKVKKKKAKKPVDPVLGNAEPGVKVKKKKAKTPVLNDAEAEFIFGLTEFMKCIRSYCSKTLAYSYLDMKTKDGVMQNGYYFDFRIKAGLQASNTFIRNNRGFNLFQTNNDDPDRGWKFGASMDVSADLWDSASAVVDTLLGIVGIDSGLSVTNLKKQVLKLNADVEKNKIAQNFYDMTLKYFIAKRNLENFKKSLKFIKQNINHIKAKDLVDDNKSKVDLEEQLNAKQKLEAGIKNANQMTRMIKSSMQKCNPSINIEEFLVKIEPHFAQMLHAMMSGVSVNAKKIFNKSIESSPDFRAFKSEFTMNWRRLPKNFLSLNYSSDAQQGGAFVGFNVNFANICNAVVAPFGRFTGSIELQNKLRLLEKDVAMRTSEMYIYFDEMNHYFQQSRHLKNLSKHRYDMWKSGSKYDIDIVSVRRTMADGYDYERNAMQQMAQGLSHMSHIMMMHGLFT